jgi:acetyltransferase-like isoleucine patch superfamily enzyme
MPPRSHGDGQFQRADFAQISASVVLEAGVLVFHPENIFLGEDVYVGHYTILKGYYKNQMHIGAGTWIGQQCFFHSAGGITIGRNVGIAPSVKLLTSYHDEEGRAKPILHSRLVDLGVGTIVLPGVTIGRGAQIGAGAVVTRDIPPYSVAVGVPAHPIRQRPE